ncbi:MAG: HD-GYP domain-containing protein [Acidimicrobiales bacterium]
MDVTIPWPGRRRGVDEASGDHAGAHRGEAQDDDGATVSIREMMSVIEDAEIRWRDWLCTLVKHVADVIAVIDAQGSVVYANPSCLAMFGVSAEQAIGSNAFQYVHLEDRERVVALYAQLAGSPGATMTDTIRFRSAQTGGVRFLEVVRTNLLHVPAIASIVVNGRDVTDRNAQVASLKASFGAFTSAIANMVDLRDPYTAGHQREVALLAGAIARELGLADDDVQGIEVAATLHDIGKIAVPSEILNRPGRLSRPEFEIIKVHSQTGSDIVAEVPFPWPVSTMILQHHERLDGSGYPNGLTGGDILMGSRILAIADVISAMASHRPYRPALGIGPALAEIAAHRGDLFDPDAVDASLRLARTERLPLAVPLSH